MNVMLSFALGTMAWFYAAVTLLGSIAVYVVAMQWSGHIGWWPHFYFALVEIQNTLVGFKPSFRLSIYIEILLKNTAGVLMAPWFYSTVLLTTGAAIVSIKRHDRFGCIVLSLLVSSVVARFVLFPIVEERIYGPVIFAIGLLALFEFERSMKLAYPPLKWSSLMHGFEQDGGHENAEEETPNSTRKERWNSTG